MTLLVESTLCVSEVMTDRATHGLQDLPAPAFKVRPKPFVKVRQELSIDACIFLKTPAAVVLSDYP